MTRHTETISARKTNLGHLSTSSAEPASTETGRGYVTAPGATDSSSPHDTFPEASPYSTGSLEFRSHEGSTAPSFAPQAVDTLPSLRPINYQHDFLTSDPNLPHYSSPSLLIEDESLQHRGVIYRCHPFENIQDACLLRYFVEELAHWVRHRQNYTTSTRLTLCKFDLCDEQKHFQFVVPLRARCYPPLLYAIFAVSARHLSRLQQYRTAEGIRYHGQLLPNLMPNSAMEYMLKCIPALREFHHNRDEERQGDIIATAVILRQFEEMEDDEDEINDSASIDGRTPDGCVHERVNFLAIINAVLRCSPSEGVLHRKGLFDAACWMALRQEIYHSFTKGRPPQMVLAPERWLGASMVNKLIMHTAQVAKWFWDGKPEHARSK